MATAKASGRVSPESSGNRMPSPFVPLEFRLIIAVKCVVVKIEDTGKIRLQISAACLTYSDSPTHARDLVSVLHFSSEMGSFN